MGRRESRACYEKDNIYYSATSPKFCYNIVVACLYVHVNDIMYVHFINNAALKEVYNTIL